MKIETLGWNAVKEEEFRKYREAGYIPGRVASVSKNMCKVYTEKGENEGIVPGKLFFENNVPVVGDWVAIEVRDEKAVIKAILPRKSKISRKTAGAKSEEQIITANVDIVFVVMALNDDYNLRRIERYAAMVWDSGASPVVVLSKADLCDDVAVKVHEAEECIPGIDVIPISVYAQQGIENMMKYLKSGVTISLIGSSGAGKSTLINAIIGEDKMKTNEIRESDGRGRHTTTHREMIVGDNYILIDNPGMREIQLYGDADIHGVFDDIETAARECRFKNCSHESEPGCAIRDGILKGDIDEARYESYIKLQKELKYTQAREREKASRIEKDKWKAISKLQKSIGKKGK